MKIKIVLMLIFVSTLFAQTQETVKLNYISPNDLISQLDINNSSQGFILHFDSEFVSIRINDATNEILISGNNQNINKTKELVKFYDVSPKQIIIEVKIVEINNSKSKELGFDWDYILNNSFFGINYRSSKNNDQKTQKMKNLTASFGNVSLGNILNIIKEKGVGNITNVPKIVTTNNKKGSILDGHRIKYVARYSSYSNLYETEEITSGLSLSVTPSLGESGYIKLKVDAKMTSLGEVISGSPSEFGQILNNTIIVKNDEPFLLGGFKRKNTVEVQTGIPVLRKILPFIFSKKVEVENTNDVLLVLTTKVIDLNKYSISDYTNELK